jgi:hypothetical protein
MCNRRTITETIGGPATEALERSLKRRRTEKSLNQPLMDTTFSLHELYNDLVSAVDGIEEAFPPIVWNFDDSDTDDSSNDQLAPSTRSLLQCVKQQQSSQSLMRSKSFRNNLSDMNQGYGNGQHHSILESRIKPLRILCDDEINFFPIYPNGVTTLPKTTTTRDGTTLSKMLFKNVTDRENDDCFQQQIGLDVM